MKFHNVARVTILAMLLALVGAAAGPGTLPARAQTSTHLFRVAPAGANSPTCGSASAPCRTIQYAVSLALDGDTILVAGGTYTYDPDGDECTPRLQGGTAVVCFFDRTLTIQGGFSPANWVYPDPATNETVIDGERARRAVRLQRTPAPPAPAPPPPPAGLRIEGITIRNGVAQGAASSPDGNVFGGGLLAENAFLVIRDVTFTDNQALGVDTSTDAGGVGAGGGLALNADIKHSGISGELLRVVFANNQATGGNGLVRGGVAQGGGLFTYGVTLSGQSVQFTGNSAVGGDSNGSFSGGQRADALGGAAAFQQRSVVSLQTVAATNNWAAGGSAPFGDGGGAWGGAFYAEGAVLTLQDADVRGNLAQGGPGLNANNNGASIAQGGALASMGGWEGTQSIDTSVTLDRVLFINNTCRGGSAPTSGFAGASGGGAVALTYSYGANHIVNTIFADNVVEIGTTGQWVGGGGGGLWLQGVVADVVHTTFARNQLSDAVQSHGAQGLALIMAPPWPITWTTSASVSYSIIADHISSKPKNHDRGLAAVQCAPGTGLTLNRGLWAGNTLNDNSGDAAGWRCDIQELPTMLSATSAGFVSAGPANYNYHLLMSSPARDQAVGSTLSTDMDGDPRTNPDIGADEWVPFPLAAAPGDSAISLSWWPNAGLGTVTDHYDVVVTCPSGGAPPRQGACGTPINAGTQPSFSLTGLTNGKTYTVEVQAQSAADGALSRSDPAGATPFLWAYRAYLPVALRGSGG